MVILLFYLIVGIVIVSLTLTMLAREVYKQESRIALVSLAISSLAIFGVIVFHIVEHLESWKAMGEAGDLRLIIGAVAAGSFSAVGVLYLRWALTRGRTEE